MTTVLDLKLLVLFTYLELVLGIELVGATSLASAENIAAKPSRHL